MLHVPKQRYRTHHALVRQFGSEDRYTTLCGRVSCRTLGWQSIRNYRHVTCKACRRTRHYVKLAVVKALLDEALPNHTWQNYIYFISAKEGSSEGRFL